MSKPFFIVLVVICLVGSCVGAPSGEEPLFRTSDKPYLCSRPVSGFGNLEWTIFGTDIIKFKFASVAQGWAGMGFNMLNAVTMNKASLVVGYPVRENDIVQPCVTQWLGIVDGGHPKYDFNRSGVWSGAIEKTSAQMNLSFYISFNSLPQRLLPTSVTLMLAFSNTAPTECPASPGTIPQHTAHTVFAQDLEQYNNECCASYGCANIVAPTPTPDPNENKGLCSSPADRYYSKVPACVATNAYTTALRKLITCRELRCTCVGGVTIAADTCSFEPSCVSLNCQYKKSLCDTEAFQELAAEPSCQTEALQRASMTCIDKLCEVQGCSNEDYTDACTEWNSALSYSGTVLLVLPLVYFLFF
jgi:hypothetical protein